MINPYSDSDSIAPLEIRVYPGHDGSFTMTKDDGLSYDYANSNVRTTTYKWTIQPVHLVGKSPGSFQGKKVFNVIRIVVGKMEKTFKPESRGSYRFEQVPAITPG